MNHVCRNQSIITIFQIDSFDLILSMSIILQLIQYLQHMKIVISGGGICGLTLAVTAKQAGLIPIVIQKSANVYAHTFGGGIGLWPPSQLVYQQLGLSQKLKQVSGLMPNPYYLNEKGWKLGQPSPSFHQKYKILCLQRQSLSKLLYQQCQRLGVEIRTGVNVIDAQSSKDTVNVELSNGDKIDANVLIGADGINSNVRNIIMRQRKLPEVKPFHCGYAYFRAVIDLSQSPQYNPRDKWHKVAFQSWGQQKRFGYVPLKQPKTFWFFAVPLNKNGLSEYIGSHVCSQQQKKWILKQLGHWKGPIPIKDLIQMTPANFILRTDIRKIKGVTEFPWNNKHNNILIVGDAANATAPNIAQGAGLAIESAWDLISMVDFETGNGIDAFLQRRRKRATTVQTIADLIASFGQISQPVSTLRDIFMAGANKLFPITQQRIFESAVRYSLGGSGYAPHWLPSVNKNSHLSSKYNGNILKQAVGQHEFSKLPEVTKQFRSSFIGRGSGLVSVKSGLMGKIFGLPPGMQNERFDAFVDVSIDNKSFYATQKWTRIFAANSKKAVKYSTIHHATPEFNSSSKTGLTLTETVGDDFIRKNIKFGYDITLDSQIAKYKSNSVWLLNQRLPIPKLLLPKSEWFERQTLNGWEFDGKLSLPPILGGFKFFQYKGCFTPYAFSSKVEKQVVIAGGTGFIGSAVARKFHSQGWNVVILSRKSQNVQTLPFARVVQWNPSASHEKQQHQIKRLAQLFSTSNLIINLAGQNPGANRWNDQTKDKIINSRLSSIQIICKALQQSKNDIKYIQASAAGFYGNRGGEILNDDANSGPSNTFRVKTCIQIENITQKHRNDAMVARIGHVFGHSDGIFPFIRLSSQLRAKKFGKGEQYIPWIHVQDVANAFYFMANNSSKFQGKLTNIASPDHQTYDSLYKTMGQIKNRGCYFTIPAKLLQLAMGQLSSVVLQSQRMHPLRLLEGGFKFQYENLTSALLSKQLL